MRLRPATILSGAALAALACADAPKGVPVVPPVSTTLDLDSGDASSDSAEPSDSAPTDTADTADTGEEGPQWDDGPPPVVVLFIGDGMGREHLRGASLVKSGEAGTLFVDSAPYSGLVQTASLSGYTDSAAAATTMATGHKTFNGRIGQDMHGNNLDGLVDIARLRGLSVGVVTTDTLTGATPSSFFTHAGHRYDTDTIVLGFAEDPPEVMLGGGSEYLLEAMVATDAHVSQTDGSLDLAAVDLSRPLVGLMAPRELPFIADMAEDDPTPRLPALVSRALDHLLTDPDGTLLIVEGARIDHASHANRTDAVFYEVLEFDQTIQQTVERLMLLEGRAVTVLVTADHECGGLDIQGTTLDPTTGLPDVSWVWTDHTNRDVPVFGWGEGAQWVDGIRAHNAQIWAVLDGALRSRDPVEPTLPRLPDGDLDDLGAPVVVQTVETNFGAGYNQLDALRVTADSRGLWIGIDGVFDAKANGVVVWLDLDPGAGTGVGAGMDLIDPVGVLDRLIGAPEVSTTIDGLGFDAAVGQTGASLARTTATRDNAGVRQFQPPLGEADDIAWRYGAVNYDDGNVADESPAPDALGTGESVGGMEVYVPYAELWEEGLPEAGASLALMVTLSSSDGHTLSNQALPPQDIRGDDGSLVVSSVVRLSVDVDGNLTDGPRVEP